jgi:hypothetical protein
MEQVLWLGLLTVIPLITGAICSWRGRAWWFGALVVVLVLAGEKQLAQQSDGVRIAIIAAAAGLVWVGAAIHHRLQPREAREPGHEEGLQQAEAG